MTGDRTVVYVMATPDDAELNAKQRRCALVCKAQGWEVVRHVRERDPDRPKLAGLLDDTGGFDRVLFYDWAAMSSDDGQDLHPLVHRIHGRGVQVSLAAAPE